MAAEALAFGGQRAVGEVGVQPDVLAEAEAPGQEQVVRGLQAVGVRRALGVPAGHAEVQTTTKRQLGPRVARPDAGRGRCGLLGRLLLGLLPVPGGAVGERLGLLLGRGPGARRGRGRHRSRGHGSRAAARELRGEQRPGLGLQILAQGLQVGAGRRLLADQGRRARVEQLEAQLQLAGEAPGLPAHHQVRPHLAAGLQLALPFRARRMAGGGQEARHDLAGHDAIAIGGQDQRRAADVVGQGLGLELAQTSAVAELQHRDHPAGRGPGLLRQGGREDQQAQQADQDAGNPVRHLSPLVPSALTLRRAGNTRKIVAQRAPGSGCAGRIGATRKARAARRCGSRAGWPSRRPPRAC
jgi:hypothetical protein